MQQAARRDLRIPTDCVTRFAFRVHEAAPAVDVSTISVGDWVHYDRRPWYVHTITTLSDGRLRWQLGLGLFYDPVVVVTPGELVSPSVALTMDAVDAAYVPPDSFDRWTPPAVVAIPTTLEDSGTVGVLTFDPTILVDVQDGIDYFGDGPSGLHAPFDITATIDGERRRVIEGQLSFIRTTSATTVGAAPT